MQPSVFRSRSRIDRLGAQQLFQQVRRASRVASPPNDDTENHALVIRGAQKHTLSSALASHLIELPAWRWRTLATSKIGCDPRSTPHRPGTDGFVTHIDAAIRGHFFDIKQAQSEQETEPNGRLNHGGWGSDPVSRKRASFGSWRSQKPGPSRSLACISLTTSPARPQATDQFSKSAKMKSF